MFFFVVVVVVFVVLFGERDFNVCGRDHFESNVKSIVGTLEPSGAR